MAALLNEISREGGKKAFRIYEKSKESFFPLIGAVLAGVQNGQILGDNANDPEQVIVEHSFGFAQIFGQITPEFVELLKVHLLVKKDFSSSKLRLYTPFAPDFLMTPDCDYLRSERCRFYINSEKFNSLWQRLASVNWQPATYENFEQIEKTFNLATRFWPDKDAFIANSGAVTIWEDAQPASICYAAAIANNAAEIDVLTAPEKRGRGYGLAAAANFIHNCLNTGIAPLWDCFTNNSGSMALANRLGYEPAAPYPFFTIPH